MENDVVFALIATISTGLPLIVGLKTWQKNIPGMKLLMAVFIITLLVDGYAFYQNARGADFEWSRYLFTPLEYALLAYIFSRWQKPEFLGRIIRFSIPLFLIICLLNALAKDTLKTTNNFTASVACVLYIVISMITIAAFARNGLGRILKEPRIWVSFALLLYSAGSLTYFAFLMFLPISLLYPLSYVHNSLNIATNLLYTGGYLCQRQA
jgi:hypothetical protein